MDWFAPSGLPPRNAASPTAYALGDILFAAARLANGGENPPKSLPRQRLTNPL